MNPFKKTQILIVDDYPTNIKVLSDLLLEYGFEVLIARDGENALQKLQRITPDMILLDVLMPGIDGFETCRRLKAQASTWDIPVIFMTALADPIDKIKGLTLGAVDYITKPFQQDEVLARVNSHLKLRHLTKQLEEQNARLQEEVRCRQIAESALRFSEEKFAKAFRSNPGAMMILTLNQAEVIDANLNFCRILDLPPDSVVGRAFEQLQQPNQPQCDRFLETLRQQGEITNETYWLHTLSGQTRCLSLSAEVVHMRELPCILVMAVDSSAAQQAAAALEAAKAAAELASQAKSQFLAHISHELRTPLNTILGYAQLMRRGSHLDPDQQANLEAISRSSDYLLTLINDVLEMAKIESNQLSLNESRFDLYQMLVDLSEMLMPKARAKQLKLSVARSPGVPQFICSDETKLRQVLLNLLGNAIKFTQTGQVTLQVEPAAAGEPGGAARLPLPAERLGLRFTVSDTGMGIAPHELGVLFTPFGQTEAGQQSQEGTGLGLTISQRFVQLLGGEIEVSSRLGEGSVFSFEIDVLSAPVPSSPPPAAQRVLRLADGQSTYRLLVVDDQTINRQLLVKLFSSAGFEVREAGSGSEAVSLARSWQPHLIWMDIRMPETDGCAATRQIRQAQAEAAIAGLAPKIIALTANAFEEERAAALAAGCDDFVLKPIHEATLFDKMAQHLGVRYLYGQPVQQPPTNLPVPAPPGSQPLASAVRQTLWEIVDGDEAFLIDYLKAHLEDMPQLIASLEQALAQQDADGVILAAHTLKGTGLTFGASRLSDLCLEIEQQAKLSAEAPMVLAAQRRELAAEVEKLAAAVKLELETLGHPQLQQP